MSSGVEAMGIGPGEEIITSPYPYPIHQHDEMMFYLDRMVIERVVFMGTGGTLKNPLTQKPHEQVQWGILEIIKIGFQE